MPECTSCGEKDFECIDGEYYCTTCQTLSQIHGLCAVINEEQVFQTLTRGARINLRRQTAEAVADENPKDVLGRPWKTHEGFQHILRGQVNALIELGVDPKLEGIVFRLWVLYLQKCGIAFLTQPPSPEQARFQRLHQRVRDKYLGTMENPRVKAVRSIIALRKRSSWLEKHQNEETNDIDEDFYEGDDPNEKPLDDIDVLLEAEERDREICSQLVAEEVTYDDDGVPMLKKTERKDILRQSDQEKSKISLCKVIGLVYIGLQFTNNRVLPHDLVRWIKQSKVPYNRAKFPEDMKFFASDYQTFCCPGIPAPNKIVMEAAKLVSFLGLKTLPEVNITCIVHRFIIELGLPGELHTLVANLIQVRPPSTRVRKVLGPSQSGSIDVACMAMAYVIITLKMIFGVDDVSEWKLSKYAQILSSFIEFDPPLFIWSDWVAHAEKQMSVERGKWFPDDLKDMRNIENVETAFDHFDSQKGKLTQYSTNSGYYSAYKKEIRKLISDSLNDMYEGSQNTERRRQKNQRRNSDSIRDPFEESVLSENERQLFQDATLQYILEPKNFLDGIGSSDNGVRTESNSYDPQSFYDDNSDSELNTSLDMFDERGQKRKSSCAGSSAPKRTCIRLKKPGTSMQEIRDNLPFSPQDFPRPFKNYALFEIPDRAMFVKSEPCLETYPPRVAKRYQSYDWLLKVCSSHISEDVAMLEEYVQRLELVLVADSKELSIGEETKKVKFLSKCFSKKRKKRS